MIKVSVIVPVYNTERFIRKCIDSVLRQTYQNIEVILVDDGSSDKCPKICDEYEKQDNRVIVLHQKNSGVASARKNGLEHATGDYVMFIDSDDWIDLTAVKRCVSRLQESSEKLDCVIFSYVREYSHSSLEAHIYDGDQDFYGRDVEDHVYRRLYGLVGKELKHPERLENLGSCCMKMYKTELANRGKFYDIAEIGSSEDTLFNMFALIGCEHVIYMDDALYHYRKMGNSITSTYRPELARQWDRLFDLMELIISDNHLDQKCYDALNSRIILSVLGIGMNEMSSGSGSFQRKRDRIREYISSERYQRAIHVVDFHYAPLPWKMMLLLAKYKLSTLLCLELAMINRIRKNY